MLFLLKIKFVVCWMGSDQGNWGYGLGQKGVGRNRILRLLSRFFIKLFPKKVGKEN